VVPEILSVWWSTIAITCTIGKMSQIQFYVQVTFRSSLLLVHTPVLRQTDFLSITIIKNCCGVKRTKGFLMR